MLNEWAACHIEREEDIRDLFVPNFYFGCEPDDPLISWAFSTSTNPASFYANMNPGFFKGTVVEKAVESAIA
ncbi:MAG: hypothetical protein ABR555_06325 [Pyrinomonadaceae bacterium]